MTPIKLFGSDLDGTLLGDPESTGRFKAAWRALPGAARPRLCYASGRLVEDVLELLTAGAVPRPDYIIGGVGTQIFDARRRRFLTGFDRCLQQGWDLHRVDSIVGTLPGVTRQPARFLHAHKSSWYLDRAPREVLHALEARLAEAGLAVTLVYSSGLYLDVLPKGINKGFALAWLSRHLGVDTRTLLVAGDTGNDTSMFLLPGTRGIVVGNAHPELVEAGVGRSWFHATRPMAAGVIQGLQHFGVLP